MPVLLGAAAALLGLAAVLVAILGAVIPGFGGGFCQPAPGQDADGIPPRYLNLYLKAARKYGISWSRHKVKQIITGTHPQ